MAIKGTSTIEFTNSQMCEAVEHFLKAEWLHPNVAERTSVKDVRYDASASTFEVSIETAETRDQHMVAKLHP